MKKVIIAIIAVLAAAAVFMWKGNDQPIVGDRAAIQDEIDEMQEAFLYHEEDGVFNECFKYYLADLNDDGTEEMLRSFCQGSGLIRLNIDCLETQSSTYSQLGGGLTDYTLYVYKDTLYIIATENLISSRFDEPHAYRPTLENNMISYTELDADLEAEILENFEKEYELPLWTQYME